MKKVISIILILICLAFSGCKSGNQNKEVQNDVPSKKEIIMYKNYTDIPDFGNMCDIESNREKEQLMSSIVKNGLVKVYDIPENKKNDIKMWEDELKKNGFNLVEQEDKDDGSIRTYQNGVTHENVVVAFSKSTVDENDYVVIISITRDMASELPSANDSEIEFLIEKQNRIQNDGWYLLQDNWLYGLTWKDDGSGFLAKIRTDGNDYTKLSNIPLLDLFIENGFVYGVSIDGEKQGIYRVRTSGEEGKRLLDVREADIQVDSKYIYYSPDKFSRDNASVQESNLYRCNLDGTGVEKVISKRIFCWFVFGDLVLYQDDADNESLHLYNMKTKEDKKINNQKSYSPIYDGNYIYYVSIEDESEASPYIWRVKVDGSDNQKIANYKVNDRIALYKDYIYFSNLDDKYRIYKINKDGSNLTQITQDVNCSEFFFSGDLLFYLSYENNEYIDKAVVCNSDGGNAVNIEINEW